MREPFPTLDHRIESNRRMPMLVWRLPEPLTVIASGPLGGGIGLRHWMINASVDAAYARMDPDVHLGELADGLGLDGPGVGMLTARDVAHAVTVVDEGVTVVATVGLGQPTWAADDDAETAAVAGTINMCVFVPRPLSDAALVNAVATATEAKVQALWECGVEATGTATDALCVACPPAGAGSTEPYGGPRSTWGARLARATRTAVADGTRRWLAR